MPSLRARLVELALPLLGVKRFFSEPERMDARIAKMRQKPSPRPRGKWHREFDIVEEEQDGFPVVHMTPKGGAKSGGLHLLYLHGGGYVMDIAAIHWEAVGHLCAATGASASVALYPLAPEAKAAETVAGVEALFARLAERHGPGNIAILGDSAGAGMALALAQRLAEEGAGKPAALVLYSPWLDATASDEGQAAIEPQDRMLAIAGLQACGSRYAGDLPLTDPRLSPLFGPLDGLPPIAIFAGTHDILLPDARRLVEKLTALGAKPLYREYEKMFHDWMLFPIPEGRQALDETAAFLINLRGGSAA